MNNNLMINKDSLNDLLTYSVIVLIIFVVFFVGCHFLIKFYNMLKRENMTETKTLIPASEHINTIIDTLKSLGNQNLSEIKPETIKDEHVNNSTKQIYAKYDEITLPSSTDAIHGYIGRDQICFRHKLGDIGFMNKRPKCMACQVDTRSGSTQHLNTNVITSCVYAENSDPNDPTIWTKQQCIDNCKLLVDGK